MMLANDGDGKGGLFQVTLPAGVWARPFSALRCCLVDAACSKVARLDLLLIYFYTYSSNEHSCGTRVATGTVFVVSFSR